MPAQLPDGTIVVPFGPSSNCTLDLCPLEWSVYEYRPSLGANVTFIALYVAAMAVHLFLGLRWRQYWFAAFMVTGCVVELVGYAGRIMLYYNPFAFTGFMLQIVFITSGPVFYTAAIYVTISKAIEFFAPELSRFKPKLFYWVFIPSDLFCLALQAAGGALSTTSSGASKVGVDLALAGLSLQVFVLVCFCAAFADYMVRYLQSRRGTGERLDKRVKLFFGFLSAAVVLILARCAYRVDELSLGYTNSPLIQNEGLFIGLEGVLVILAVFCLCIGHPGFVFNKPAPRKGSLAESGAETGDAVEEAK